jgi:GAF domain-containing protein
LGPIARQVAQFVTIGMTDAEAREMATIAGVRGALTEPMSNDGLGLVEDAPHPRVFTMPTRHDGVSNVLVAPIRVRDQLFGHLYLTEKAASNDFSDADLDAVATFAVVAGIAISSAFRLPEAAAPDHGQIARELHDTVIQRLYGIGVALQGSLHLAEDERLRSRIQRAIDDLDDTISHVRATIAELGNLPLE